MLSTITALFVLSVGSLGDGYQEPHPDIAAIVDTPPAPSVRLSPDGQRMLLVERDAMPTIADMARPMLRLAGVRIDPAASARWQSTYYTALAVRGLAGGEQFEVPLPEGARFATMGWSDDSLHFAYVLVTEAGSELWIARADAPQEGRQVTARLNRILGSYEWLPGGKELLIFEVPADRGAAPVESKMPTGPNIEETSGTTSPLRTYQDLLEDSHDEALFAHYATSQLVRVNLETLERELVGPPAMYRRASPSPDGSLLLVETLTGEMSFRLTYWGFPHEIAVWNLAGERVQTVANVPMAEGIPIGGVRTGPRSVGWLGNEAATLAWFEALDGGDPKAEVTHRDRLVVWVAPFDEKAGELLRVEQRARSVSALADPARMMVSEYDRDRRWTRTLLHNFADKDADPLVIEDRSIRDRYGDPGSVVFHRNAAGRYVPLQHGSWIYRSGQGASPEGVLPFLDRLNIENGESERLWRCEPGSYETVVDLIPNGMGFATVTRHETPTSPPNYRLRSTPSADPVALTEFPDPTPQIRGIHKELVTYERADGVPLSATLYLPADYEEGQRLPLLVWAYPIEFNDPKTAGQVTTSDSRFTRISGSSHLALVTRGYAVMDGATMPVIGDAETMNDTFIDQIVGAAAAAIQYADERGVADPTRVGVGGHSYGAFMTANLLAHCDLFAAGVARSGAYNRTLTPFGFQSERRSFWEASETYFTVSPFMHADKINEPLLLIHGEEDNNSGTFPMQSKRLYAALQGNGGTARLVMLPNESHGYRARESVLHTLAEMERWFDRFLKGPRPAEASAPH